MPTNSTQKTKKSLTSFLLEDNNLVAFIGYFFAIASFCFGIGFYFGNQNGEYRHTNEINNLNFSHLKELNAEIEKARAAEDKLNQEKVDELKTAVSHLEKRIDGKR